MEAKMIFYKYHGCGNDFILIDEMKNVDYRSLAVRICERRTGIGADGLIVCSRHPPSMRIFNSDGTEASMCGNGIRCAARYFADTGISGEKFGVRTLDGVKTLELCRCGEILVDMGEAHFSTAGGFCKTYMLDGRKVLFYEVFVGCAHAVVFCDDIYRELLFGTAAKLSCCELFPQKINVDLVRVDGRRELTVRTFERGAGYTAACGTGACASYAVARKLKLCDEKVTVHFELGSLCVSGGEHIRLCGGAELVFKGEWGE